MNRKLLLIVLSLAFAAILYAQGDKTVKITGNLIDNACAESAKDLETRAKNHSTSCALMDGCEKSGYAVYADKKLYKLDDKGNDSAADLLKNTKTQKGVKVTVEGTIEGDTIHVTKLTEATEAPN
jgi:type 1 fimbria pilin